MPLDNIHYEHHHYPTMDTFRRQAANDAAYADTADQREAVKEARKCLTIAEADYSHAYNRSYDRVYDALKDN